MKIRGCSWTLIILGLSFVVGLCGPQSSQGISKKKHTLDQIAKRVSKSNEVCKDKVALVHDNFTGPLTPCANLTITPTSWFVNKCILSISASQPLSLSDPTFKAFSVWLYKNASKYEIKFSTDKEKAPQHICFMEGQCHNVTLDDRWEGPSQYSKCNINCLNTRTACNGTSYVPCSDKNTNYATFDTTSNSCTKCGTGLQVPKKQFKLESFPTDGAPGKQEISPAVAANAVKEVSSLVSQLGEESTASVDMGPVKGMLVSPKKKEDLREVSLIYSAKTNMAIVEDEDVLKDYPVSISVSKEAFERAYNASNPTSNNSRAFAAILRFPNMSVDVNDSMVLRDEVYSIAMGAEIKNLKDNIKIFRKFQEFQKDEVIFSCQSWNGTDLDNWTAEGCNTTVGDDGVMCECSHLTFFAVLMTTPEINITSSDLQSLTYITYIGCGLSMFFLGVGLFMHFVFRRGKASHATQILINLFVALFLLNLTFLTNEYIADLKSDIGCKVMAGFMHYCMLASFSWFAVEAFHLCLQLSKYSNYKISHYIIKVCVVGWVPPGIVVIVIYFMGAYGEQIIYTENENTARMCWILNKNVHYVVNIGYYALVFLFTFTTFIIMIHWLLLLRQKKVGTKGGVNEKGQTNKNGVSDVITVMGLCCILGITWSFAFFSHGPLRLPSYYIFTILNSFQGLLLFIYYYNTSKLVGEPGASSVSSSADTEHTQMENPYSNPKLSLNPDSQLQTT